MRFSTIAIVFLLAAGCQRQKPVNPTLADFKAKAEAFLAEAKAVAEGLQAGDGDLYRSKISGVRVAFRAIPKPDASEKSRIGIAESCQVVMDSLENWGHVVDNAQNLKNPADRPSSIAMFPAEATGLIRDIEDRLASTH